MGNWTHYQVLVKKNFITLRRNYGFAVCFAILPIVTMGIFALLIGLIANGNAPEQNNFNSNPQFSVTFLELFWTTTRQVSLLDNSITFADIPQLDKSSFSSLYNCLYSNYTDFAFIGDSAVLDNFQSTIDLLCKNLFSF